MMAKRHNNNDFDQLAYESNRELETLLLGNDHVPRADSQQEPLPQRAFHRAGHCVPAIAKDVPAGKQVPSKALMEQLQKLEVLRSQMSKEEYEKARDQLQRGILTLGHDPNSSASPTAKRLREKLAKAFGAGRER